MFAKTVVVVLATGVVSTVTAAVSSPLLHPLYARQFADPSAIPALCQPACAPIEQTISTCMGLDCLCSNEVAAQIASCANCLIGIGDSATANQQIIDQYTNACITSGAPISSIQVSSVPPSTESAASGATSATSGSTTSPQTTPTTTTSNPQTTDLNPTSGSDTNGAVSGRIEMFGLREAVGVVFGMSLLAVV